jgi:hypothetical protein
MAGLVEEGEEVMSEGKKKDDAPADLTRIGAAQRDEHYENMADEEVPSHEQTLLAAILDSAIDFAIIALDPDKR